jgi:hypothetical protein
VHGSHPQPWEHPMYTGKIKKFIGMITDTNTCF